MSETQNVQVIKRCYDAFGRGDVEAIVAETTPDVKWVGHFEKSVPWGGEYTGRIPDFFHDIFNSVDVLSFEPTEFISEGDTVTSLGKFGCRSKATGKSSDTRWAFIFKLRDGKIYSYEQFHDPQISQIFTA